MPSTSPNLSTGLRLRRLSADEFITELAQRAGLSADDLTWRCHLLTWAPDGRATFEYGASVKEGQPHVRWRRVGTQDIFKRP
jgi:hypothetical protein